MLTDKYRYHIYPDRIYVIDTENGKVEIPGHRLQAFALRYSIIQKMIDEDPSTDKSGMEPLPLDMPRDIHSSSE